MIDFSSCEHANQCEPGVRIVKPLKTKGFLDSCEHANGFAGCVAPIAPTANTLKNDKNNLSNIYIYNKCYKHPKEKTVGRKDQPTPHNPRTRSHVRKTPETVMPQRFLERTPGSHPFACSQNNFAGAGEFDDAPIDRMPVIPKSVFAGLGWCIKTNFEKPITHGIAGWIDKSWREISSYERAHMRYAERNNHLHDPTHTREPLPGDIRLYEDPTAYPF